METVRRRRLEKGDSHEAVEQLLSANGKLYPLISVALFDNPAKTNDVPPKLQRLGPWAVEAFKMCKMGAHERHEGELKLLIDNSQRLAKHPAGVA